jgi:hypothetical protein
VKRYPPLDVQIAEEAVTALRRAISRCPCDEYGCYQCDVDRQVKHKLE